MGPAATVTNEQEEANHVADDERRARKNGDVPLGGQMCDGSCGRRMRERNEGVKRADQRARPGETPSRTPPPLQSDERAGSQDSRQGIGSRGCDRKLGWHIGGEIRDQEANSKYAKHLWRDPNAQSVVRR